MEAGKGSGQHFLRLLKPVVNSSDVGARKDAGNSANVPRLNVAVSVWWHV